MTSAWTCSIPVSTPYDKAILSKHLSSFRVDGNEIRWFPLQIRNRPAPPGTPIVAEPEVADRSIRDQLLELSLLFTFCPDSSYHSPPVPPLKGKAPANKGITYVRQTGRGYPSRAAFSRYPKRRVSSQQDRGNRCSRRPHLSRCSPHTSYPLNHLRRP